eukprot:11036616-Karenia_brevis.AAC.1
MVDGGMGGRVLDLEAWPMLPPFPVVGGQHSKTPGYTPHLGHEGGELVGDKLEYGEAGRAKPVYTPQPGHLC